MPERRLDDDWEVMTAGIGAGAGGPPVDSSEEDDEFQYQMTYGSPFLASNAGWQPSCAGGEPWCVTGC